MFKPDEPHITNDTGITRNGPLPPGLRRIAEEELGETDTAREDAVAHVRELLAEGAELNPRKDEEFLLRFIRIRKYDVEAAMKTIRNYYRTRAACPSFDGDFLPSRVPPAARTLCMVLPEKDAQGRLVFHIRPGAWIPSTLPYAEFHRAGMLCIEQMACDPTSQTAGVVFLVDYQGLTPEKLFYYNIGLIRQSMGFLQDAVPMRMKGFHAVGISYGFNTLFALLRPFMKKKLADRIHLHGHNFENLHEDIPPSILPEEYGGDGPPLNFNAFWTQMEAQESSFVENNSYGYKIKSQESVMEEEIGIEITAL